MQRSNVQNHLLRNFACRPVLKIKTAQDTVREANKVSDSNQHIRGFGGLEVACWPLVPTFAGSNATEAVGSFRAKKKILSTPSFGGEVKPSVPCRRFTACKRSLNVTWKSDFTSKIHRPFLAHVVPPLAARIS